jgi:hypothetical protein
MANDSLEPREFTRTWQVRSLDSREMKIYRHANCDGRLGELALEDLPMLEPLAAAYSQCPIHHKGEGHSETQAFAQRRHRGPESC